MFTLSSPQTGSGAGRATSLLRLGFSVDARKTQTRAARESLPGHSLLMTISALLVAGLLAEAQAAAATRRTTLNTDVPAWAVLVRVTGVLKRTLQRASTDVAAASREVALTVVTAAAALAAGAVAGVAATRQRRALLIPGVPSGTGRFSCAKSTRRSVPARFR
jgi:hypothetical protein